MTFEGDECCVHEKSVTWKYQEKEATFVNLKIAKNFPENMWSKLKKKYITVQTCTKQLRETHSTVGSTMIVAFWLFAFRPRNVCFMIFVCRAKNSLLQLIRTDQVDLHRWYQEPRGYSVIGYVCVVLSGALFKMRFDKRQRKGFQKRSPV